MLKSLACLVVTAGLFVGGAALPAAETNADNGDSTEQFVGKGKGGKKGKGKSKGKGKGKKGKGKKGKTEEV